MSYHGEFIEFLLEAGVLTFGDFVTKSGRKTPYFLNMGNIDSGKDLLKLGKFYSKIYKEHFDDTKVLYGPAYKGISLSVATSIALYDRYKYNVPITFNRKEMKAHGEGGQFIGKKPEAGDRFVIIEDVMTAGTAVRETLELLKPYDVSVDGIIIAVDRMEKGSKDKSAIQEFQEEYNIPVYSVVTIVDLVEHLYNKEINGKVYIDEEMKQRIDKYLEEYGCL